MNFTSCLMAPVLLALSLGTLAAPPSYKVIDKIAICGKPEVADIGQDGAIYFNIEDTNEVAALDTQAVKLTQRHSLYLPTADFKLAADGKRQAIADTFAILVVGR